LLTASYVTRAGPGCDARQVHHKDIDMEVIWHILLTVCLGSTCLEQDIQWFDTEVECNEMLTVYTEMPADGDWDTVEYQCKPVGSVSL
jgi:hypothetical protein